MLGSPREADDAVVLRLRRADASSIDNLPALLTTVTARVGLDMLRSRKSRRDRPVGAVPEPAADASALHRRRRPPPTPTPSTDAGARAAQAALVDGQVGLALKVF